MRSYEQTHAFLDFSLDVRRFEPTLWVLLGEASSKWDHIAGTPLEPAEAMKMHRLYLAKGAAATTAIEGNTLSEEEVIELIEGKATLPTSQAYLKNEIQNILDAFDAMIERLGEGGNKIIDVPFLQELNRLVLKDLPLEADVVPGMIRQTVVGAGTYRCPPPEDCAYLIQKFCDALNDFPMFGKDPRCCAIIKAIFAHIYFVWVHPFRDGNGRTARLVEAYILLSANCPTPVAHLLSNYFNRTRSLYYQKLDEARLGGNGPIPFIEYAVTGLVEGMREQIQRIRNYQWEATWENYVHKFFHEFDGPAHKRRRKLVLSLPREGVPITTRLKNLPAEIRLLYGDKSNMTYIRDIHYLEGAELICQNSGRYIAARQKILAFLPWRVDIAETVSLAAQ
jgi:Fic family protein